MTKFYTKLIAFDTVPSEENSIYVRVRGVVHKSDYPHVMEIEAPSWKAEVSRVPRPMENVPEGTSKTDIELHYRENTPRITFKPTHAYDSRDKHHGFTVWMHKDDPIDFDLVMKYIEDELKGDENLEPIVE